MIMVYTYTPLIRLGDLSYPKYMNSVRSEFPNSSFPNPVSDEMLEPFGYAPVIPVDQPAGDVVVEGQPEHREDGYWYQGWDIREFTPEEVANNLQMAKDSLKNEASFIFDDNRVSGISYTFQDVEYSVPVTSSNLCLLLSLRYLADTAEDSDVFSIKMSDSRVVDFLKQDFLSLCTSVFAGNYAMNKKYWAFIGSVNEVPDIASLPSLPETFK